MKRKYFFIIIPLLLIVLFLFFFIIAKISYKPYYEKHLNSELHNLSYCLKDSECETYNFSNTFIDKNIVFKSVFKDNFSDVSYLDYNRCNLNIYKNEVYDLNNFYEILNKYDKRRILIHKITFRIVHPFKKFPSVLLDDFPIHRCDENKSPELECVNFRCVVKE